MAFLIPNKKVKEKKEKEELPTLYFAGINPKPITKEEEEHFRKKYKIKGRISRIY